MNVFRKIFSSITDPSPEEVEVKIESNTDFQNETLPVDDLFTQNFKKNGGKFLYCENQTEMVEQFENILEENDWFETEAQCFEMNIWPILKENNITFENVQKPNFLVCSCESLLAEDGAIMISSNQIKQLKIIELPVNIIVIATTSQIVVTKSDGLREIKKRYSTNYPTNITTIKYFEKVKEEDFLHYGSSQKNVYLLLVENL